MGADLGLHSTVDDPLILQLPEVAASPSTTVKLTIRVRVRAKPRWELSIHHLHVVLAALIDRLAVVIEGHPDPCPVPLRPLEARHLQYHDALRVHGGDLSGSGR